MHKSSFSPIRPPHAEILILGSLPGDVSLAESQYYAHPQNRFWKVLFQLFDTAPSIVYNNRLELLHKHHIALWDVCHSALRPGSMDTAISQVIPNDIPGLLMDIPSIRRVFFNGKKAASLYEQYFKKLDSVQYEVLPSTSPANAQYSLPELVGHWSVLKNKD